MFGVLPPEIEVIIIEMLPNKDLASMEMTSSHFKDVVGGEDQAQRESYIEIHQPYPSNHANSRHIKTNKIKKL